MTPQEFIRKWRPVALTERATAQSHFLDLCSLLKHPDPVSSDPLGESFTFEKGLTKVTGGDGFADVWKKGYFGWEYKKKKTSLELALDQLVRYATVLENPPLQVACDTEKFLVRTAWTNSVSSVYELSLEDLADPAKLDILHSVFFDPDKLRPKQTRAQLTTEAADRFSALAVRLEKNAEPPAVAHFVNQLVFCFFANSVRLLPTGFFQRLLRKAESNPGKATQYLDSLFSAMQKGGEFDLTDIAHFNGGLFDGSPALPLESSDIELLIETASMDWSQIDPSIFGTLFERFLDPEKRGQIGAHYTDAEKIIQIIEPVIAQPLQAEWVQSKREIQELLDGRRQAPFKAKPRRRMTPLEAAEEARSRFLERLRSVTILDPACGSGNFLYTALQIVKDLENKANLECESMGLAPQVPVIGPEIVHGIEKNHLAAELARTTIWIGDIQWGIRNGIYSRPQPILRPLDSIECRDAVLNFSGSDQPTEATWPEAEFIVGNPPFLGSRKMAPELGAEYAKAIRQVYSDRIPNRGADYVCFWFAKAWSAIKSGKTKYVGLIATRAIAGGASRVVLEPIAESKQFLEVRRDEDWIVEGAAVRVAIICISARPVLQPMLDGSQVDQIFSNLRGSNDAEGVDLTKARRLRANLQVSFQGVVPRGSLSKKKARQLKLPQATFVLSGQEARSMLMLPLNVNGRSNDDVVVPYLNGKDVTGRRLDRFIVDFQSMSEANAMLFEKPYEYIKPVKLHRAHMAQKEALATWWQFWRSRFEMRAAIKSMTRYIATSRIAKHRIFVWAHIAELPDNAIVAIARDDDVSFGILHSRAHRLWSLQQGTALEDRPRYTPTTTFETFPFPEGLTPNLHASAYANDDRAKRIAIAAATLDSLRNKWLYPDNLIFEKADVVSFHPRLRVPKNAAAAKVLKSRTLTKLYNAQPDWLIEAHRNLDEAVVEAYGWSNSLGDDELLEKLLILNLERTDETDPTVRKESNEDDDIEIEENDDDDDDDDDAE